MTAAGSRDGPQAVDLGAASARRRWRTSDRDAVAPLPRSRRRRPRPGLKHARRRPPSDVGRAEATRPPWSSPGRRVVDIVLASSALTVATPALAVAAVAIKLDDGGPVLFRQRRIGQNGEPFTLLKL